MTSMDRAVWTALGSARHLPLLLLASLIVGGCSEKIRTVSATAMVVSVNSDIAEIASLRVSVLDSTATKNGGMGQYPIGAGGGTFPFSFTVVPSGETGGRFRVRVEGLDADDVVLVSVQAQATFLSGRTRLMTLWLAKVCKDVTCEDDETCHYEEGDRTARQCGEILNPKLTDFESGADGDLSLFPSVSAASSGPFPIDADGGSDQDAGAENEGGSAGDPTHDAEVPRAPNLPTVGSFRSLGVRRANADGSLILYDDGFEESGKVCNPDGLCAVAGFTP
jgi:hypothetical protein